MTVEVVHAGPVPGRNGIVHLSNKFENVESWKIEDGQVKIKLMDRTETTFNWAHVLRINVDNVGTVRI